MRWTYQGRPIGGRTLPGYGDCDPPEPEPPKPVGQECARCCVESDIRDMNQHPMDSNWWLCETCDFDFDVCVGQCDDDCLSLKGDSQWVDRDLLINDGGDWLCPSCAKAYKE